MRAYKATNIMEQNEGEIIKSMLEIVTCLLRLEQTVRKKKSKDEIRAEKAKAKRAEKKKRKAEWKKACKEDSESKACKEGKPTEKIKNVLKKIEKKIGG